MTERVTKHLSLAQRLSPVLGLVRAEGLGQDDKHRLVREWFTGHEQNLVTDLRDLADLCRLPDEERRLLTYPVIGNFFLDRVALFKPRSKHQEKGKLFLMNLIRNERFCNPHTGDQENSHDLNLKIDQFNVLLLRYPKSSMSLHSLMEGIYREVADMVQAYYEGDALQQEELSSDLGHGLVAPARHFAFLTWPLSNMVEAGRVRPLGISVIVVDDVGAKDWYERLIAVGFKDVNGQQGYFGDCESALNALAKGHYDVILSDLDLGADKMRGEEFAKEAYRIQKRKGIKPKLYLFSDDARALSNARLKLQGDVVDYLWLKSDFSAIYLRIMVG